MKKIDENIWKSDTDKIFIRIKDGITAGSVISLGDNDSILNYAEVTKTTKTNLSQSPLFNKSNNN